MVQRPVLELGSNVGVVRVKVTYNNNERDTRFKSSLEMSKGGVPLDFSIPETKALGTARNLGPGQRLLLHQRLQIIQECWKPSKKQTPCPADCLSGLSVENEL